jgi:non-specific protein-tyrosine kinase
MNPGPLDLRDYLSILWARRWTIIAVVATATAVALFYSYQQTPVYTSSAEVVVQPARFDPGQPSAAFELLDMKTEQQVANSVPVTRLATQHLATVGVTPGSMSAAQVEDTETILFTSVSADPAAAQATANAYSRAYLDLRQNEILAQVTAARAPYEARIAEIKDELAQIVDSLPTTEDPAQRLVLTTKYSSLLTERALLVQKLNELIAPEDVQVGEVLRPAKIPGSPSAPRHLRDMALGLIVGLTLGVGVAFFQDHLDDRVRGREELELYSGAPVLAFIPTFSSNDGVAAENGPFPENGAPTGSVTPTILREPTSDAAEAYKGLRVRLLHAATQHHFKSIVITSSLPSEGKTSTTANLGVALAQVGKRVVMLSADLRRPRLQEYFPPNQEAGLIEVLMGKRKPLEALAPTGTEFLRALHAGQRVDSPGPLELLGSDAMTDLLTTLASLADFILIDTPPVLSSSDVAALAPITDGVLFVADPRLAQRSVVEQARHELELIGAPIVGVVVNKYDPRRFRAYGSGYGYYTDGPAQGSAPPASIVQIGRTDVGEAEIKDGEASAGGGESQS